jgi:hypothetical protein
LSRQALWPRADVGLDGQGLERWPVEFLEQLPARAAEPTDRPLLVEPFEQLANRRVEFGQAVEPSMAQPRQNPPLDDENRRLDLGFVARPTWAGWEHRRAVMRRHLGIGPVDLRLVQAGLDGRGLLPSGSTIPTGRALNGSRF